MIQEYRGYIIDGRKDFKIEEIDENYTLFEFDPELFIITAQQTKAFKDSLPPSVGAAATIDVSEAPLGIITMRIHSETAHYYAAELIKERIIMFVFDCRIDHASTTNN